MPPGQPRVGADEASSSVIWRDGAHIRGTSIWCDARRARDVCFVSSADRLAGRGHGQLVATAPTLALIARADRRGVSDSVLSVPCARPFTLGTRRIELVGSGSSPGAASLLVEVDGRRIVYAGAVNPHGGGVDGPADVRSCDTLVVDATYGDPRFSFPPIDELIAEVTELAAKTVKAGAVAVLLVHTSGKALDVAHRLASAGIPLRAHRRIHHAAQRLRAELETPPIKRWAGNAKNLDGCVLLWPLRARQSLDRSTLPKGSTVVLLSGDALDPEVVERLEVDHAVPWSSRADHDELLRYIDAAGANEVYLTERYGEALSETLNTPTRRVYALGPPRQMSLF